MLINPKLDTIRFDGGSTTFDFINTVHDRTKTPMPDYLLAPVDLLYWARRLNLITSDKQHRIREWIASDKGGASESFSNAILLRECLFNIFDSIANKKKVKAEDLTFVNAWISRCYSYLRMKFFRTTFVETWEFPSSGFDAILMPIARDTHRIMLSIPHNRIKECPNCGWIFVDKTKNGRRRWCSMETCGSIVKSLDYYYRQKERKN